MKNIFGCCVAVFLWCGAVTSGYAQDEAELAKKLQNPVADLISVPMQNNWDFGIGPKDATNYLVNVEPVIPFSISDDWNLITRTIVPFLNTEAPAEGTHDHTGLGDITQSFFLSPKEPIDGWIFGAGPEFLYPTATDSALGAGKWGLGPTFVVLQQECGWTYGTLVNHIWSIADDGSNEYKPAVSDTYLQPFVAYTTSTHTTFTLNTESTYDWHDKEWTAPLNLMAAQLLKIGEQPIQFQAGIREYMKRPDGGPNWGLRFAITVLFPK